MDQRKYLSLNLSCPSMLVFLQQVKKGVERITEFVLECSVDFIFSFRILIASVTVGRAHAENPCQVSQVSQRLPGASLILCVGERELETLVPDISKRRCVQHGLAGTRGCVVPDPPIVANKKTFRN